VKYKTLFRLALKVVGICSVIAALPTTAEALTRILISVSRGSWFLTPLETVLDFLGPIFMVGAGCYLFFGGEWIVNKAIPSNRPYCHECGYMLKNLTGNKCPECDTPFRPEPPAHGESS
jgi:hypothetical protein